MPTAHLYDDVRARAGPFYVTGAREGLVAPDGRDPARPQSDSAAVSEQVWHADACSE